MAYSETTAVCAGRSSTPCHGHSGSGKRYPVATSASRWQPASESPGRRRGPPRRKSKGTPDELTAPGNTPAVRTSSEVPERSSLPLISPPRIDDFIGYFPKGGSLPGARVASTKPTVTACASKGRFVAFPQDPCIIFLIHAPTTLTSVGSARRGSRPDSTVNSGSGRRDRYGQIVVRTDKRRGDGQPWQQPIRAG